MERSLMIAGFGGQGVLIMGKILAQTVCLDTPDYVSLLPTYGAEQRGGTANCYVVISQEEVDAPLANSLDELIVLNEPSLKKYLWKLAPGGTLYLNDSLISSPPDRTDITIVSVPGTELARELGDVRVLNSLMLGLYLGYTQLLPPEHLLANIVKELGKRPALIPLNTTAFEKGLRLGEEKRGQT